MINVENAHLLIDVNNYKSRTLDGFLENSNGPKDWI